MSALTFESNRPIIHFSLCKNKLRAPRPQKDTGKELCCYETLHLHDKGIYNSATTNNKSKFRMADFAHFTALYLNSGEAAEKLLMSVVKTQHTLVIEGDILLTLMTKYVSKNKNARKPNYRTARLLYKEFDSYIMNENGGSTFPNDFRIKYDNPISLATHSLK